MKVSEIMTKNPVTVQPSATAKDAAELMKKENLGTVLVAEEDHLEGIVTDRQIATKVVAEGKDPARTRVNEFMTKDPVSASPDMEIEDVTKIMGENKFRRVPVVQDGKLMGIVSTADIAEHVRTCDVCIDNILNEVAKAKR
jgi:CBS domain-containing protein